MTAFRATLILALSAGMAACGSPSGPTPPPAVVLAKFTDSVFNVVTSDVRDVQDQIVQFDTTNNALIWKATNQSYSGYTVSGDLINAMFRVVFGIKDGDRRAYFTEAATGTVCDIEIVSGQVVISPTNVPVPTAPIQLAMFSDSASSLMTPDVRDVDGQIVRFDTNNRALIWAANNKAFPGYTVNGDIINHDFQVRFGTEDGERRAYFTETARPFICNIEIVNGQVVITATNVPVPGGN